MTDYELLRGELDIIWHTLNKSTYIGGIALLIAIMVLVFIFILASQIDKLNGNINMLKELLIDTKVLRDSDFEHTDKGLQQVQDKV